MISPSHAFWKELASARLERRPRAWASPFGAPVASPEGIFAALLGVARQRRAGEGPAFRLFADRRPVALDDGLLPDAHDASTGGYVRRLDATLGETGLVINDLHVADHAIWRLAVAVCAGLQRAMGVAPGGFSLDLFTGAYRSGFFGVHKDDQEVVTFVLEGRKRFLLWPFEALGDRPGVPPFAKDKVHAFVGLDYEPLRESAIVLEGGPGDVFYWPADHWHVAESDEGLCTTLGLGLFAHNSPTRFVEEVVEELVDEGALAPPGALPAPEGGEASALLEAARSAVGAALDHPELSRRLDEKILCHASSFGFRRLPPVRDDAPVPDRVHLLDPALLAWAVREDDLVWSVCGAIYRYPVVDALITLFSRLAAGEVIDVDDTTRELSDQVEPEVVRHVLGLMARHHALFEPPPDAAFDAAPPRAFEPTAHP